MHKTELTFTLWIENKPYKERQVPESELIERFEKWLIIRGADWVDYYGTEKAVCSFLGDPQGMNATFQFKKLGSVIDLLKPSIKKFLAGMHVPVIKQLNK